MKHDYIITFSFWKEKKIEYFEMIDLEDCFEITTRTKTIKAETQQQAKNRLEKTWSIPIKILSIKEQHNERERER